MSTAPGFPNGPNQVPPMNPMNPMNPMRQGNPAMAHLWIQVFLAKINEPNPEVFANQAVEHFRNTFGN